MKAYRIRKLGELWQLLLPADGSCIGASEELGEVLRAARSLAERNGCEVHLFGNADRLDAVLMNLDRSDSLDTPHGEPSTEVEVLAVEPRTPVGFAYG